MGKRGRVREGGSRFSFPGLLPLGVGAVSGILTLLIALTPMAAEKNDFPFRKQPEIQQVKPQKPVKVKLHRNAKGEYSWGLEGDNADEIVNTDRKLRRLLKLQ
ncbi:MAG: hypothetical protein M1497_07510 [Nitrospirae bacterium]|nr:hypothetical protein [Nitrospirota bacterium]